MPFRPPATGLPPPGYIPAAAAAAAAPDAPAAAAAAVQAATAAGEAPGRRRRGAVKFTPGKSGASSSEGSPSRPLARLEGCPVAAGADDAVAAAAAAATVAAVTHAAAPAPVEAGAASATGRCRPRVGRCARRPPAAQHSARRAHEVSHLRISRFILERVAVQAASRSAQGGATAVTATPNNTVPTVKPTAAPAADAPAPKTD